MLTPSYNAIFLTHCGPVVKEFCSVVSVGGGAKDVHHHEVLDVVVLPPRLFQLVNVVPTNPLHLPDHWNVYLNVIFLCCTELLAGDGQRPTVGM